MRVPSKRSSRISAVLVTTELYNRGNRSRHPVKPSVEAMKPRLRKLSSEYENRWQHYESR
jgi:hypothetical protein